MPVSTHFRTSCIVAKTSQYCYFAIFVKWRARATETGQVRNSTHTAYKIPSRVERSDLQNPRGHRDNYYMIKFRLQQIQAEYLGQHLFRTCLTETVLYGRICCCPQMFGEKGGDWSHDCGDAEQHLYSIEWCWYNCSQWYKVLTWSLSALP